MTDNLTGRVLAVATLPLGSVLVQDAPAGSSILYVEDAVDFNENGGSLQLGGVVLAYTACDDESGAITLAGPIAADAFTDDRVEVYDPETGSLVVETIAQVVVDGTDQGGDPLDAIVDHSLVPFLPDGIRDDSVTGAGESVTMQRRGDDLYVLNIIGREVVFDGAVIAPETITETQIAPDSISTPHLKANAVDGMTITGAFIRTAATGKRWEILSPEAEFAENTITGFSGSPAEYAPGHIIVDSTNNAAAEPYLQIASGMKSGMLGNRGTLELRSINNSSVERSYAAVLADLMILTGPNHSHSVRLDSNGFAVSGTKAVKGIDFGAFSSTANASGDLVVSHGLGVTPASVVVTPTQTGAARMFAVVARTSTTFTVRSRDEAGATVASGATIAGNFVAFA